MSHKPNYAKYICYIIKCFSHVLFYVIKYGAGCSFVEQIYTNQSCHDSNFL